MTDIEITPIADGELLFEPRSDWARDWMAHPTMRRHFDWQRADLATSKCPSGRMLQIMLACGFRVTCGNMVVEDCEQDGDDV